MVEPEEFKQVAEEWAKRFGADSALRIVRLTTIGFFYERRGFIAPQFIGWGRAKQQLV